jgi:hypothetical protein
MSMLNGRATGAALASACIASAALATASVADAPPAAGHKITVLPARDTVVGTGYAADLPVVVSVLRYDVASAEFDVVARSQPIEPQDDPATVDVFDGVVAVNRRDGGCWRRITPDIRAGDRVRIVQRDDAGTVVADDSTVTGSITPDAPQFVFDPVRGRNFAEVHGTAPRIALGTGQPVTGARVPLGQLEVRIANDDGFATNGRRVLVSSADGTLRYDSADPADSHWTARFPVRAIDEEEVEAGLTRAMWLGRDPEAGTELTVAEARAGGIDGGPRGGCDAPAEGSLEAGGLAPEASDPGVAAG